MPNKLTNLRRYLISGFVGIAAAYLLFFMPLPYYVLMPGTAEAVEPMVHFPKEVSEKGVFMLTTVRGGDANLYHYFEAKLNPYEELVKKDDMFGKGQSEQDYAQRQQYVMLTSQSDAMQAAYKKAGISYHIQNEGVMVLSTLAGMPAQKLLQDGDYLLKVDNTGIHAAQDLLNYVKGKKAGDTIHISYRRGTETHDADLTLGMLPQEKDEKGNPLPARPGLGIVPGDVQSVKADDESKQLTVKTEDIGGPSAGLMFSLEMYSQLTGSDLTKGYRIAGTGTISDKGEVGVIGGIQHKIVAADREKADIFFAPKDLYPKPGETFEPILNYTDALNQAKKIGSKMKIVPVQTMDDALNYLNSLTPKSP